MAHVRTVIEPRPPALRTHLSPLSPWRTLWQHRHVVHRLGQRQVAARYRGSFLGSVWNLANPLLLLGVYTLVFTKLMPVAAADGDRTGFVLRAFCGLVLFGVFSETVLRAPSVVLANANYVKKVVFPLEVLPVADLWASAVSLLTNLGVLLVFVVAAGELRATAVWFPLVLPPLLLTTLGVAWLVAALGVYVRDLAASIGVLLTMLFFLTPVFYRLEDVEPPLRSVLQLNPLAVMIDTARDTLLGGAAPDLVLLGAGWLIAFAIAQLGFTCFAASKRGFADVV